MILIVSSSLNSDSNSRLLAEHAERVIAELGQEVALLDLREFPLPLCDGGACYGHPNVSYVGQQLRAADAVIIATAIYNYDANAAAKNLIELTGDAWENKVVGFLCAAGGMSSYMSIMSLANSLMLDFRSVIVPRFVYATDGSFTEGAITDVKVKERVADLALETVRLSVALAATPGARS
jgi:NAD(P)H-dependent FMN reductase